MDMVRWLAVLTAAIAGTMIGGIWYSPQVLGTRWMRAASFTDRELEQLKARGMAKSYLLCFVSAIVMAFVLGCQLQMWGQVMPGPSWLMAIKGACWNWLGFIAPVTLSPVLWMGRPWSLFFISGGYYLLSMLSMAFILVYFAQLL